SSLLPKQEEHGVQCLERRSFCSWCDDRKAESCILHASRPVFDWLVMSGSFPGIVITVFSDKSLRAHHRSPKQNFS
ncbi:hypothetical protein U0070_021455, partial [Myodes glareolus]